MLDKRLAKRELQETADLCLLALQAEERVRNLPPETSLAEAERILGESRALRRRANERFRVMCARLAVHLK